jgi:hypothetical protein
MNNSEKKELEKDRQFILYSAIAEIKKIAKMTDIPKEEFVFWNRDFELVARLLGEFCNDNFHYSWRRFIFREYTAETFSVTVDREGSKTYPVLVNHTQMPIKELVEYAKDAIDRKYVEANK